MIRRNKMVRLINYLVLLLTIVNLLTSCAADHNNKNNLENELKLLSKQVTTLLDRRRDDLKLIEDSLRRKLSASSELLDVKEELRNLR